jgi:two-component system, chemotaxis family, sensor kinase CheA
MNIRMLPIRATFEKFRRLVHDLARDLGKDVELTMEGADTELDKTVIDQLGDPLMHLIRNSMDHGIEPGVARWRAASGRRDHSSFGAALGGERADRRLGRWRRHRRRGGAQPRHRARAWWRLTRS